MQKLSYILLLLLIITLPIRILSQTIEVEMPSCYALQYTLALNDGVKKDTILIGRLDTLGKATLILPEKHSTYRGVATLSIPFGKQNINIVLAGEDKIIINESPSSNGWSFKESDENKYLLDMLSKQIKIIGEYNSLANKQPDEKNAFSLSSQNIWSKNEEHKTIRKEINESSLYAARMLEILNCISGVGSNLNSTSEQIIDEQKVFLSEKLDFKNLYTSGFWELILETYYQTFSTDDTLLLNTTQLILDKTEDIIVRRELTQSIILLFSKYGKDNLLMELGEEYLTIPINGKLAPQLVTDGIPIEPKQCLIFFYDSNCGMCHNELHQLIEEYSLLNNDHNQIEVISVSADTNKDTFEYTASKMPWKDKLCDLKGFAGENFVNYGIVGTPTLILVDKEGIVRGRYMRLSEFIE